MKKNKVIKFYNQLFTYNLKPSAFKVYIYLSTFFWWKDKPCVKLETISKRCNISINTAQRAINELCQKELIIKCDCYKDHRRTTNTYTVKKLSGKYTIISRSMFFQNIDNSAFKIFCAIAMRKNHAGKAFPSLTTIQRDSKMSKNTIIAKIQLLNDAGYILKTHKINQSGCFGNNNHTVLELAVRTVFLWLIRKAEAIRIEVCIGFEKLFKNLMQVIRNATKSKHLDTIILLLCRFIQLIFIVVNIYYNKYFGEKNSC